MPSFADHPAGRRVNGAKGSPMEKRTRTGLSIWLWSRKLLIVNFSDRTDHPCGDWVLPPSYRVDLGDWSYFFFSSVANNTDNSRTVEKKLLHQSKLGRDICFRIRCAFAGFEALGEVRTVASENLPEQPRRCYALFYLRACSMFRGIVKFRARIVEADKGLTIPLFDFNPNEQGIEKVEIEGPDGDEILTAVYLTPVATPEEGISIALNGHMAAIDRISFNHEIAIENGHVTEISPTDPAGQDRITPGTSRLNFWSDATKVVLGLSDAASLKKELEQAAPAGERNFPSFALRCSRQARSRSSCTSITSC